MAAWLYFLLFVAPVLTAKVKLDHLDQAAIQVVFGGLQNGGAPSFSASPFAVQPVTAAPNATLVDPDYWDSFDDYRPATTDYDAFDWMSTRRVASFSEGNLLLSPLGLKLALAILAEAATTTTQSELTSVLGFDNDRNVARRKFSSIISSMQTASPHYDLILGSRIYIDSSVEPRQRFSAISEQFYKTQLEKLDFGNPFLAAAQVNAWVSNVTQGRILNLITEDEVKNNIVMVLTTLFFKGTWRHQFNPNATKLGTFYLTPTVQKQVSYMNVKTKFHFVESAKYDAKILRMPYLGSKFAMYIVVPNSVTGLQRVWESITDLKAEMLYLQERTVDVTLPRFKFDFTSVLDGVLMKMGIRQAFQDSASFPGLARGQLLHQRLRISKVLQRSGIEINELGSVAYSATEISLVNKFGEDEDTAGEVIANKPFMFFIEDETTRQLLFTGRVTDPLATTAYFKH